MQTSDNGIKALEGREGFRGKAYKDTAGIWTYGFGTIKVNGVPVKEGDIISLQTAEACMRSDIKWAEGAVNKLVKVPLTQNQFDALVSFTYNLGSSALEHSTLLRYLNAGKYKDAASQLLAWVYSGGKVTPGLVNRRKSEYSQFIS